MTAPSKRTYLVDLGNVVELLSIPASYMGLIHVTGFKAFRALQVLRVPCVLELIKIARRASRVEVSLKGDVVVKAPITGDDGSPVYDDKGEPKVLADVQPVTVGRRIAATVTMLAYQTLFGVLRAVIGSVFTSSLIDDDAKCAPA